MGIGAAALLVVAAAGTRWRAIRAWVDLARIEAMRPDTPAEDDVEALAFVVLEDGPPSTRDRLVQLFASERKRSTRRAFGMGEALRRAGSRALPDLLRVAARAKDAEDRWGCLEIVELIAADVGPDLIAVHDDGEVFFYADSPGKLTEKKIAPYALPEVAVFAWADWLERAALISPSDRMRLGPRPVLPRRDPAPLGALLERALMVESVEPGSPAASRADVRPGAFVYDPAELVDTSLGKVPLTEAGATVCRVVRAVAVAPGLRGARAGLAEGDALLDVDGTPVGSTDELDRALAGRTRVRMTVYHEAGGATRTLEVDLGPLPPDAGRAPFPRSP